MIPKTLLLEFITKALQSMELYSLGAAHLLLGTCGIESNYGQETVQTGGGPALGIYQMEPNTLASLWNNFVRYRPPLLQKIRTASDLQDLTITVPDAKLLVINIQFATAMCRVKYLDCPGDIPQPGPDYATRLAAYYKQYYNTLAGACTIERATQVFADMLAELGQV